MAPTTILNQRTTTSPRGRKQDEAGFPFKLGEMLAVAEGSAYIARVALTKPSADKKAKQAIKRALTQQAGLGFSLVEILSPCPTNWAMPPLEAVQWLEKNIIPVFPLGEIKVKEGVPDAR